MIVDPPGQVVAVAALKAAFAAQSMTVNVSSQKPDEKLHPQFVVLSRVGGGRRDFATSSPRFLIECYAKSEADAERLACAATAGLEWSVGRLYAGYYVQWWADDKNIARHDDPNPSHFRFQFTGTLAITLK